MKPTGIIFFPAFDWAISPTHPEREERLLYTRDQLFEEGIMDLPVIREYQPRMAAAHDIARTHICVPDIHSIVTEAHLIASGATLTLADAFMNGEVRNAFALVRPPGHHSMRVTHGNRGFCNINNEAIMVDYLRYRYGIKKLAIVDTDVHHGDGSQDIFWHDPDVLFISFHQDGRTLYPGTGFMNEMGGPLAQGTTINIPLPPGTTDEGILYVLDNLVLPLLDSFEPEIVINSAGQDNHFTDPLANMRFSARGYATLNEKLAPDICCLEGGYSVETALPYVNAGIIMAMAGLDYSNLYEPEYDPANFRERKDRMEQLKHIVEHQMAVFNSRQQMKERALSAREPFASRHRSIFYDTDYFSEEQNETLRLCPDCSGYLAINSRAKGISILALIIPFGACANCREEARKAYDSKSREGTFDFVYLQDKPGDTFLVTDRRGKELTI